MIQPPASTINPALFLRLPRELRDEIYFEVLRDGPAVSLIQSQVRYIPSVFQQEDILLNEALEIYYRVQTLKLDLEVSTPDGCVDDLLHDPDIKQKVRRLVVQCDERDSYHSNAKEYEEHSRKSRDRRRWEQLLDMPHLEDLTINMQKHHDCAALFTLDFAPILQALRKRTPGIKIVFNISFDSMLQDEWDEPWWHQWSLQNTDIEPDSDCYEKMGFTDVSDLFAPSSDEDFAHIEEHLSEEWLSKSMPYCPSIKHGLLSETPANRRALATHYVAKEPALMRSLMEAHYWVYWRFQEEDTAREESEEEQTGEEPSENTWYALGGPLDTEYE